ncbi:MAG: radical SAM protein [Treponema sp.]|nr:radical SAM protein [Treponema sp.]
MPLKTAGFKTDTKDSVSVIQKEIIVKDLLTKSNLPATDYVINPYVGCPHACKYCYASFMKRFTGHMEDWGAFIDIKRCSRKIDINKLAGKTVFLSSVTDCYNRYEEKYRCTRTILEQLVHSDAYVSISTKSDLILRDIDLLKKFRHLTAAMSVNTLDETFRSDMDNASPVEDRLRALKILHENGIPTVLFMSPIFPYITDCRKILEYSHGFIDEYWFENLNLRGSYKPVILEYVRSHYPQYAELYRRIYGEGDDFYWNALAQKLSQYCRTHGIKYKNYFHHSALVQKKHDHVKNQ